MVPAGWKEGTRTDTGVIFDNLDAVTFRSNSLVTPTTPATPTKRRALMTPDQWNLVVQTRVRNATEHVERLAELLGVSVSSLEALAVGWDSKSRAWTTPHRNAGGEITGVAVRYSEPWTDSEGKVHAKASMPGTRVGLFFDPASWNRANGPVFLPEGASDVAALMTMDLAVVGRPSNVGGVDQLVELLAGLELERPIVVIGERDQKPDGFWPGRDGAQKTARTLAGRLGRRVGWSFPPDDAKDSRGWLNAVRSTDDTTPIGDVGLTFTMEVLATTEWLEPPSKRHRKTPEAGTPVHGVGGGNASGSLPHRLAPPPTTEHHENTGETASDNLRSVRNGNPNLGNPPSPEPQNDPVLTSEPRVEIYYRAEEQARIVDECLAVMADHFFVRSGELVHVANPANPKVATSAASASVIVRTTKETVSDFLSRNVEFVVWEPIKPGKGDANQETTFEPKTIPVPRWLPERLVGMQTWRFLRRLAGIAHGPFLRLDGTVGGRTPGYDDASEIMVIGDAGWPEIADTPTDADVRQAVTTLLHVVREFPFDNPAGKAVWLSAVLSAVARPAIAGPVPLHVVDASTRGSGKSKLCKVASLIAEGVEPAMESLSADDREMDKRLLAVLAEGSRVVVFDNIQGPVGGASLDRFLTATVYGGRVLGSTQMLKLPNLTVPLVTTNNASVTADTARRCVSLRLTPDDELPEERTFDVPDLEEHVRARRRELLSAALVILRNHAAKGFPIHAEAFNQADDGTVTTVPVRPKGSFEAWSRVVRHAIIGAGLPDPEVTSKHVREVDSRHAAQQAFVEALASWNPGWNGSARQLVSEVFDDQASGEILDDLRSAMLELAEDRSRRGTVSSKLLGVVVRGIRDRWFHNVRLVSTGHSKTGNTFALDSRARPNNPSSR
jgi:putative DNA primase/helicase